MRHAASLITSLEGMSKPAYRLARELAQNSKSGLTMRFLSKKLELPEEEIEYLIDVYPRLFFFDITKVKLVPEGHTVVQRIGTGLENHGDVPSLIRNVKALSAHDFRRFEEQAGIDRPGGKKAAAETFIEQHYRHPEAVVEYVAGQDFSEQAQEAFDLVWQSEDGVLPVPLLRQQFSGSDFELEQGLGELVNGFALFELFRFDAEERLVRAAALLAELRKWREAHTERGGKPQKLKALKGEPERIDRRGLLFCDQVCQLVAAIAAKPARLRGDGDLFREDSRRLSEVVAEEDSPSLSTCLWAAKGVGWLAPVDNELRAGSLDALLAKPRIDRQRLLYDWLTDRAGDEDACRMLARRLDELKPGAWYGVMPFIEYVMHHEDSGAQAVLKDSGGPWRYVSGSATGSLDRSLARALEETLLWLGVIDRGVADGENVFQISALGRALLTGSGLDAFEEDAAGMAGKILVQPNFDVVVPVQEMDPLLTVPLDQFAERRSSGTVTVYRLTKEAFTRAVQQGHDGGAFVRFLLDHSKEEGLPDNVLSTIEGWRGGLKRVRLRRIAVLEADDPLVLAELLHRRKLSKYFVPLDPATMTAYNGAEKGELAKELEREGFVVE